MTGVTSKFSGTETSWESALSTLLIQFQYSRITQVVLTSSKSAIEIPESCGKSVQSYQ